MGRTIAPTSSPGKYGGVVTSRIDTLNVAVVLVPVGEEDRFIAEVTSDGSVAYAERDYLAYPTLVPPDPDFLAEQAWHYNMINAPTAWDITQGNPSVIVAVTDTGIDLNHPELIPNIWVNPGEIPGNGIDDDLNGFIDDVNGWNPGDGNNNVQDEAGACSGHGTHVSGTVAAISNAVGGLGVAPGVTIMPVKVLSLGQGANCPASFAAIATGWTYAVDNGADVIQMSIGCSGGPCPYSLTLDNAFIYAETNGVLAVVAAGNNNQPNTSWDAFTQTPVLVAALDQFQTRASYSNSGANVDIAAPGGDCDTDPLPNPPCSFFLAEPGSNEGIYSTRLPGTEALVPPTPNHGWLIGTSMAAPHVAGCAALLVSVSPASTPAQLRTALYSTAVPHVGTQLGNGLLQCDAALNSIIPQNGVPEFGLTIPLLASLAALVIIPIRFLTRREVA